MEDGAVAEMVGRLRLLRGSHKAPQLVLSEDPRLLQQLRALVDVKPLPCFCVANELTLSFETGQDRTTFSSLEARSRQFAIMHPLSIPYHLHISFSIHPYTHPSIPPIYLNRRRLLGAQGQGLLPCSRHPRSPGSR